jgi:hypothetical protein
MVANNYLIGHNKQILLVCTSYSALDLNIAIEKERRGRESGHHKCWN